MFFWKRNKDAVLYVHFPCFDGIISAVLTLLFLEHQDWKFKSIEPVNYALRNEWLHRHLAPKSAVVDFLYHPEAVFWVDHHQTSFINQQLWEDYQARSGDWRVYDNGSGSCALLLWRKFGGFFAADSRLEEMVKWADKIDSASYDSVEEALFGHHPALVLSSSLAVKADDQYCRFLIGNLRAQSLQAVAASKEVQSRFMQARALTDLGMQRVHETIHLESSVAVFEAEEKGTLINRYVPYYYYPSARYSIALVRSEKAIKITAMRNPWLHFESINLGAFMQKFGGGGHQRVGSLVLPLEREKESQGIVEELLTELHAQTKKEDVRAGVQ